MEPKTPRLALLVGVLCAGTATLVQRGYADTLPAKTSLGALKTQVESGEIRTVRLFFLGYEIVTRTRVTPEMLREAAQVDETILLDDVVRAHLLAAIDATVVGALGSPPDLRWGAIFLDSRGKESHAVYLDGKFFHGAGRRGIVDGNLASFNGALVGWFEQTLAHRGVQPQGSSSQGP